MYGNKQMRCNIQAMIFAPFLFLEQIMHCFAYLLHPFFLCTALRLSALYLFRIIDKIARMVIG